MGLKIYISRTQSEQYADRDRGKIYGGCIRKRRRPEEQTDSPKTAIICRARQGTGDFSSLLQKLNESWDKVVVVSVPNYPKYSIRLNRLRSGEAYEVRVLVIDSDGKYRETGSLTTTFRTLCGRPTSPPTNVKIDNSSADSVLITWENPPRESWLCWSVNVTLEVNGTTESFNLTEPGVNATDRFVVSTRPFTELTVRLRLDTPEGISSQWTRLWTVRSAEDAPSEVRQLQMTRSFARQASFTWLPPATPNGLIRDYGMVYRPLRLVLPCSPIEQTETKLIVPMSSRRVNLEELRPYTVYIISVHAVTVTPGPEFTTNFTTEQAVPEGTPSALNYSKGTGDEYVIFWGPVPCELANGVVRRYYLELDSADPWESRPGEPHHGGHETRLQRPAALHALPGQGVRRRTTRVALMSLPSSTSPRHLPVRHFPLND
ncbi:hypothetical protein HPB47_018159 [Ixodes persulcatus]|uniref:Uncharacterized protein n=1 Tax=Ixodes persulcatus TaxID=34615 RepID=A0AC60QLL0_IXOPE|nr:hypothetical protein HPB47_018159 [Ixodes persulcatus]